MLKQKKFLILILVFISCIILKKETKNDDALLLGLLFLANQPPQCDVEIKDPLFSNQWHLKNTGQNGGTVNEDGNVTPVWSSGNWGFGVKIAIVDDGIDIGHQDLIDNVLFSLNYNYVNNSTDLSLYTAYAKHGSAVAGVSAGRCNDKGVRGVAPLASLIGYNVLLTNSLSNNADSMVRNKNDVMISNNSWGATDGTGNLDDSLADSLWKNAIIDGIQNGRNGKGIVYLWAAGNGRGDTDDIPATGTPYDDSNYDGQANFYGVIAVCAVTFKGKQSWYSERGANLWICAPSSGTEIGITTTDIRGDFGYSPNNGYNDSDYTNDFGGTSSATPYISGVVALMLAANPFLSYRDIRYILAKTARKVDSNDSDWTINGGGFHINHKYGFGVVDTSSAVEMAKTFTSLGDYNSLHTFTSNTTTSSTINISSSNITKIEFVEVNVQFDTSINFGNLQITLQSPSGTQAKLVEPHQCDPACDSYTNKSWRFGVSRFLDENPNGNFTLTINNGILDNWSIKIYGR